MFTKNNRLEKQEFYTVLSDPKSTRPNIIKTS